MLFRLVVLCSASLISACADSGVQFRKRISLTKAEHESPSQHTERFPIGVLNKAWADNRTLLQAIRDSLEVGRPVVIEDFLLPEVAEALYLTFDSLASQQTDDHNSTGYPFEFVSQGPWEKIPRGWTVGSQPPSGLCQRVAKSRPEHHGGSFVQANHKLAEVGEQGEIMGAFQTEMERPGPRRLWAGLVGLPQRAADFAGQWSWFRKDDFYSIHEDSEPFRYLAITLQLTRDWPVVDGGGENVWCGPKGGSTDITTFIEGSKMTYARDGTALPPGFNRALVFPVSQKSSHAVAPVLTDHGRRFTIQGWYNQYGAQSNDREAMTSMMAWSKHWEDAFEGLQPPIFLRPPPSVPAKSSGQARSDL